MSKPYTGGCACGQVRYSIADEPMVQGDCQCRDCQRKSGTGHGSYLTFPDIAKAKVDGKAAFWDFVADSGNVKKRAFCPSCGTPVYMTFSAAPQFFTIHAASLDEPARYRPQMVFFTARGHAWDRIDPTLTAFEGMPPPG